MRTTLIGAACLSIQPLALNALSVPALAYIIRELGPERYGQWTVATALLTVATLITSLGLRGAFVRALASDPAAAPATLAEQLGLRLVLAVIAGGAVALVCLALSYPAPVLACTALGTLGLALTAAATTFADLLQAMHRARTLAAVNGVAGLSLTAVSVIAAWSGVGPAGIAAAYLTGPALSAAWLGVLVRRQVGPVGIRWSASAFGRLAAAARHLAAQQLLAALAPQAEAVLLPRCVGVAQFGHFSAGTLPATRLAVLPDSLCTAAYPALVQECRRPGSHAGAMVMGYLAVAGIAGAAMAAAIALVAGSIGRILFPADPAPLAAIVSLTVWCLPFLAVESVMGYALNAAGRDAAQARATVPATVLSLLFAFVLIPAFGVEGACWSMLLRPIVRALCLARLTIRTFRSSTRDGAPNITAPAPLTRAA